MEMEIIVSESCIVGYDAKIKFHIERYFCDKTPFHYLHFDFCQSADTALQTSVVINSVSSRDIKKLAEALNQLASIVKQDEELAFAMRQEEEKAK
jgi:hypothetical protein